MKLLSREDVERYRARRKQDNLELWLERNEGPMGMNTVSDHDEDYVFDALFDVPNR